MYMSIDAYVLNIIQKTSPCLLRMTPSGRASLSTEPTPFSGLLRKPNHIIFVRIHKFFCGNK